MLSRALEEVRRRVERRTFEAFELYGQRGVPADVVATQLGLSRDSVHQAKARVLKLAEAVVERIRAEEG